MSETPRGTVLFPGAGSFGGEFRPLIRELEPLAWLAKYPGRFGRDFGTPAESFDQVVRLCTEQVSTRQLECPVLLGHSFGACVAYATAAMLEEAGRAISALVVVGATAPTRIAVPASATSTPSGTAAYLDNVDPTALTDLPSEEWREVVAETAMHDLRLLGQFPALQCKPVRCPVLAVRGDSDPLTSDAGIGEWEHATHGACSQHVFSGGHSDFLRSPDFASWFLEARGELG
ncbi:thioesterase II family protein [Nocardiopsis gilva]|uniref:thioesterase II family protein n=1 Tax=Nocardiopsis gilva TaxID=280236 RepID=UPI0012FD46E4|nr:alpha/beta fold hydrolase [Nocardiopsis gilva]